MGKKFYLLILAVFILSSCTREEPLTAPVLFEGDQVTAKVFVNDATRSIAHELKFSLDEFGSPENTPPTLLGEPQGGQFASASWGQTLMRYMVLSGKKKIGDHELLPWIRTYLLKEAQAGGTTFSQLFTASTLYLSCKKKADLSTSELWKSYSKEEQELITNFISASRFWDAEKQSVGGRANNYYGVALHIEAYTKVMGLSLNPDTYDQLMAKNMELARQYKGFFDDANRLTQAYDRYLHEYIRFIWESAELVGDQKTMDELLPCIKTTSQLWWDLYSPQFGHSSFWGRSRQNSWDDTFEQAAFYITHPQISPVSPEQIAAVFVNAWNTYFTYEYDMERHLNRMLDPGRATYSYAGRDRIWSYTIGTLSKIMGSMLHLQEGLKENKITAMATAPTMTDHSKIVYYAEPHYGVWTFRRGEINVAIPFVGNGASTDYLPVPYRYPGVEIPVERKLPTLVPYFTTKDGKQYSTVHGADKARLYGESGVELSWSDLQDLNGNSSGLGIPVTSRWNIEGNKLSLEMTFTPEKRIAFEGIAFWVPLNTDNVGINYQSSWSAESRTITEIDKPTYNGGGFNPIKQIRCYESGPFVFEKGKTYTLSLELTR